MLGSCLAADELDERSCGGRDVSVLAPDEGLIAAREIAVASRNGQIAGSIRIHDVSPDMTEFGLRKEYPSAWYGRRGYRIIHTRSIDDAYPHLAPLLATPCDLMVYEKPLAAPGSCRHGQS